MMLVNLELVRFLISLYKMFEPAHETLILIVLMRSTDTDAPAQSHQSLCCLHTQSRDIDESSGQN